MAAILVIGTACLCAAGAAAAGPRLVKDINEASRAGTSERFVVAGDRLFFAADHSLWVTDGTPIGTFQLTFQLEPEFGLLDPVGLTAVDDRLFFGVRGLWTSDGTVSGTSRIHDVQPYPHNDYEPSFFAKAEKGILFNHFSLWVTDGTAAGTQDTD